MLLRLLFVCITFRVSFCAVKKRQTGVDSPQLNEDLDALFDDMFGSSSTSATPVDTSEEPVGPLPSHQVTNTHNENCTCVPYYLCNKTVETDDGTGLIDITTPGPSCISYTDVCCNEPDIISPDKPLTPRSVQGISQCGQRNFDGVSFKITGASSDGESKYGEFPWMVAILKAEPVLNRTSTIDIYWCGGSLIHVQVVLTAAHCVARLDPKKLKARAGEWDTQTKDELFPYQDRNVKEVIIHENYYAGGLHNDIALLIMESPFDIAENVDLICLPEEGENMDGRDCAASGWGKDIFGKKGSYQAILKKVELPIVPRALCLEELRKTRLSQHFKLHESFICAGGVPGKDTCKGDGGSPLVCPNRENPKIFRQAGIVAWGIECGKATPGLYVNVPLFRGWITSKLSSFNIAV